MSRPISLFPSQAASSRFADMTKTASPSASRRAVEWNYGSASVDIWFKDRPRRWLVPQNTELLEAETTRW